MSNAKRKNLEKAREYCDEDRLSDAVRVLAKSFSSDKEFKRLKGKADGLMQDARLGLSGHANRQVRRNDILRKFERFIIDRYNQ